MAYVVATGELNDERLQAIARGDDDEFVATAYRIFRAARESADDEYRQMLARVLARSGNWSDIPYSEREELLPVVLILTPRHVMLLEFLSDPRAWMKSRGIVPVEYLWVSGTTSLVAMINKYFFAAEGGAPSAGWALDAWGYLERSGLVVPDREVAPMDVFAPATTSRGNRVIAYVREGD